MSAQTSLELLAEFEAAKKSAKALFRRAGKDMPGAGAVTRQAIREALGHRPYDVAYIKDNFSALVYDLQVRAYGLYLEAERRACAPILADYVASRLSDGNESSFRQAFVDSFFVLDRFYLSLTQSRRTRAGSAFETVVTTLFEALGYPYSAQPVLSGSKPDFVLPSVAHYNAFATDCLTFSAAATLGADWSSKIIEGLMGQLVFLATTDERISLADLEKLKQHKFRLVVPKHIKSRRYGSALNVIDFEFFFAYWLDPALKRWTASGARQDNMSLAIHI